MVRSLLGLAVIVVVAILVSPRDNAGWPIFLTFGNWTNIVRQMSEIGILALGMTLVILTAGIDLSVGSVLALGATITAKVLMEGDLVESPVGHISLAIGLAVITTSCVGALNGTIVATLSIQPFIVTLATMIGVRGFARWLSSNSNIGLSFDADHVSGQFTSAIAQPYVVITIFLGCAVACAVILSRTVFGRYIRALGDNPLAAKYAGLPIKRTQIAVYAISGALAGLAGVIHCAQNSQGNPNDGIAYELDAIAAVVIGGTSLMGGKGTVFGTLIGTLMLGVITNILGLKGVDENVKWMAKAAIIIGAVLLQQPGLFHSVFGRLGRALSRISRN